LIFDLKFFLFSQFVDEFASISRCLSVNFMDINNSPRLASSYFWWVIAYELSNGHPVVSEVGNAADALLGNQYKK